MLPRGQWCYVSVGKSKPNCFRYAVNGAVESEHLDWLRITIPKGYGDGYYYNGHKVWFRHKHHYIWFLMRWS